jgi:aspartyl-tRNA(Asn)/glutamyl-tRNA(Gln) amidotransferase subunit B
MQNMMYEAVIGLEIHVQLNCPTKLFCDCANNATEKANTHICPTCIWLPGAVVQLSEDALEKAALTCLALGCELSRRSAFDQKVYYYPDLPKGYQLSQHHKALAYGGWIDITGEDGKPKRLRIHHVHMEEDVAKLVHETDGQTRVSLVDFNRAGAPLVEIVTEPDIRCAHDAMAFLRALRTRIRYAKTAECSMESGTMRCDANISLRPAGSDDFFTKVEVKNMNSVKAVGSAIDYEIQRQEKMINEGQQIHMHTRLWDPDKNITVAMRDKFAGPCIPDPSVAAIILDENRIEALKKQLPEMPAQKQERFNRQYGLSPEEAALISTERDIADYFEMIAEKGVNPRLATQWMSGRLLPALKENRQDISTSVINPERAAELLLLLETEAVNAKQGREIMALMFTSEKSASRIADEKGYRQITDMAQLTALLDAVMETNPDAVANFHAGKKQASGFIIGQAMKMSEGRANPKVLADLLDRKQTS